MSDTSDYWVKKLEKYSHEQWSNMPTYFAQEIADYLPKTGTLLELGAGTMQDSHWFASKGYKVTAADLTPLSATKGIDIKTLDMSEPLPFAPESFDIVYSHLALHYFSEERTQHLFDEIYDILKPGGIFAFIANSTSDPEATEGEEIEPNFRRFPELDKRYFDLDFTRKVTSKFEPLILDDKGTSHKDSAMGVANLIRFVGRKV